MTGFKVPYLRPVALSDPFHDFTEKMLNEILGTPDESMTWWHYQQILGPFLPAGSYQEAVYFLPLAFNYILRHDDDALDLVTSLVWFISEYHTQLKADGILSSSRELMRHCFEHWAKEFTVIHFDKAGCEEKQWGLLYCDYVKNAETLAESTCDLVRFTTNADLAVEFYERLSRDDANPTEAAWFLECARQHFTDDVRKPPLNAEIQRLLEDKSIIERSAKSVASGLKSFADFPSYWKDTFEALRVDGVPTPRWDEKKRCSY